MTFDRLTEYQTMATQVEDAILDVLADFEPLALWEVILITSIAAFDVHESYATAAEEEGEGTP